MPRSSFPRFPAAIWGVMAAFTIAGISLKLGQHFSFQTQAYDLGVFTSVLWNTLQGRFLVNSMTGRIYWTDHFSLLLPVLCPFLLLWKNAAVLLLVQTLALAASVPAVYRLAEKEIGRSSGIAFAAFFVVFPYLHRLNRFDFHDISFAVPLWLWALHFMEEGRGRPFWAALGAAVLLREDMSLAAAGLGAYMVFIPGREHRRAGWWIVGGAALLFLLEVFVLLPRFGEWRAAGFSYFNLGGNFPSLLRSLCNPATLWRNSLGDPARLKGLLSLLMWTGGLALLAPRRWILLALPVGLNLLSGNSAQNTFQFHYSAAILPFLFYAMIGGAGRASRWSPAVARWIPFAVGGLALAALPAFPRYFVPIPGERRRAGRELAAMIPPGESTQASNNLIPHVVLRERVFLFPAEGPTRWVFLDRRATGFHPPAATLEAMERFSRLYADRRVAEREGFELYRFAEAP